MTENNDTTDEKQAGQPPVGGDDQSAQEIGHAGVFRGTIWVAVAYAVCSVIAAIYVADTFVICIEPGIQSCNETGAPPIVKLYAIGLVAQGIVVSFFLGAVATIGKVLCEISNSQNPMARDQA